MEIFEQNNLFGLKNDDGTVVLPPKFFKDFIEGFKDSPFQEILKIKLVDIQYDLRPNGTYITRLENGFKYLLSLRNYNGESICGFYDYIYWPKLGWPTKIQTNDKYGLVDEAQKVVLVECKYDSLNELPNGLATVRLNKKWGLINKQGEVIVECKYDGIGHYLSGKLVVELNKKRGLLNLRGETITECKFDLIHNFQSNGLAIVIANKKEGLIDENGKDIAKCKYDEIRRFDNGLAKAKLKGKWGFINEKGEWKEE